MKKPAKGNGGAKAGRKAGSSSSARKKDDAVVETGEAATQETQSTQQTQDGDEAVKVESPAVVKEGENKEEEKETQAKEDEQAEPDSSTQQAKGKSASQTDEAAKGASSSQPLVEVKKEEIKEEGASSSQPLRRSKRKRSTTKETTPVSSAKRARAIKPQEAESEYFEEKRSLEDLWKDAFQGTEWGRLDELYEFNWNFTNVEAALEEGGQLYGRKVYVFGCTESQIVTYKDESKTVLVPAVVCVESSIPPSDKIGIRPANSGEEEIIPMKDMKMDWVPYIPLEKRDKQIARMNFQIFILCCTQRRSALKHLKEDRVKKFNHCLPYINNPFQENESEQSTLVQLTFLSEQPAVICNYDWAKNNLEDFTNNLITDGELFVEKKDEFMESANDQIEGAQKINEELKQARDKAMEELSEGTRDAYQAMRLYKFYPLPSPDTPDLSEIHKSPFINRYFGNAHEVI